MIGSYQSLIVSLLILSIAATIDAKFFSAAIARERLVTDLFVNYNANAKPAQNGERIEVSVNIELQHFDFSESDGALKFVGVMYAGWHDPKLVWNPNDYNNLTKIPVSQKVIWVPDLEVYNNAPDKFFRMHRNGFVLLEHTGEALWSDTIEVTMFCTTKMRNWPHDIHVCSMRLGSWTYDGNLLDIRNADNNASLSFESVDMANMVYKIINYTAVHVETVYACCEEPYTNMDYHFVFQRRSAFVVIFRVPALTVVFLSLLALAMEPRRSEKIWLNGVSFLLIVFNLIYFATNIGRFSRGTPLIVTFYSCSLVLVTLGHLVSVFSLMATRSRFQSKLPARISNFLKSPLVQFIGPAQMYRSKLSDGHAELNSQFEDVKLQEFSNLISTDSRPNEWTQLANFVERVALMVFGGIYLILGTVCFV